MGTGLTRDSSRWARFEIDMNLAHRRLYMYLIAVCVNSVDNAKAYIPWTMLSKLKRSKWPESGMPRACM